MKTKLPSSAEALIVALLFVTPSVAQITSDKESKSAAESKDDKAVELTAFEVSEKKDVGYFSKNTLIGTRSDERLVNIPQNIQIVNRELLTDLAQEDYLDALQYGSSGINKRTPLVSDVNLRGYRVITSAIMRDGLPFATAANVNGPTYDIERIEVVKGPAALLFGQSAQTGGIINFVTKRPLSTQESSVSVNLASYNLRRAVANSTGPIGKIGLNYRVTAAVTDAEGPRWSDYTKDKYVSLSLDQKLSPVTVLSLDYYYYAIDQVGSQIPLDTTGKVSRVPDDFSFFEPWISQPAYYSYANLVLKTNLTPTLQARAVVAGTWGHFRRKRVLARAAADATTGVLNRTFQDFAQDNLAGDIVVDFVKTFTTGKIGHKTSLGYNLISQEGTQDLDSVFIAPINIYSPVYNTPYPTYTRGVPTAGSPAPNKSFTIGRLDSGYIQHEVSLFADKVILVGGYRYNNSHSTSTNYLPSVTLSTLDRQASVKRWGAIYKPVDYLSLYYNYSESFAFNGGTFVGGSRDGQPLLPSFGINNEVGLKAETPNGMIFGSVAVYDLSLTNVRTVYTQPSGASGVSQDGEQTNKGYEADIGLSFETPVGRLQTILTYYKGDSKDIAGLLPLGVTNGMWSAYAAQSFSKGALNGVKVAFGAVHKDDIPWGLASGASAAFTQPAYTTTTALVSYTTRRYRVSVNVDNVFDKRFVDGAGPLDIYVNQGATFKFSFTYLH